MKLSLFTRYNSDVGDGGKLRKAVEVLEELKDIGVCPNVITYSILIVACEKYY